MNFISQEHKNKKTKQNKKKKREREREKKKIIVFDETSDLHNDLLEIYFNEYNELPDSKRNKVDHKSTKLFLKKHNYHVWFENEQSTDKEESTDKKESIDWLPISAPEGDEEAEEGKWLKILTPSNLLIRLPILLAQIKAGKKSYKFKNEIRQILHPLYQHNKIAKNFYNNLIKLLE